MKLKGNLYQALEVLPVYTNGEIVRGTEKYVMFYYQKLQKDMYLIVVDQIFRKAEFKRDFAIVNEKKFRKMCEGKELQVSV